MYLPFENLPGHSRIWIYQGDRPFTENEESVLNRKLREMCEAWQAHGYPLNCSYLILHSHFILLAVDESTAGASGCSIDGSVRFMKELQTETGIDFFNRRNIAFLIDQKVIIIPQSEVKSHFSRQTLTRDTLTFNNLVDTKLAWEAGWTIPLRKSWLVDLLPDRLPVV